MQPLYVQDFLAKNKLTWEKKSLQELLKSICNLDYFKMDIEFKWHMIKKKIHSGHIRLVTLTTAGGLKLNDLRDRFQPRPFYDSMI